MINLHRSPSRLSPAELELLGTAKVKGVQVSQPWVIAFLMGLMVVALAVFAIHKFPNPSPAQFLVLRTLLAIGAAAIASGLTGFIEIEIPNYVRAGGGLAVFVLVYLRAPAGWNLVKPAPPQQAARPLGQGSRVIVRRNGQQTIKGTAGLVVWTSDMNRYRGQAAVITSIETVVGSEQIAKLTVDRGRYEWHLDWIEATST